MLTSIRGNNRRVAAVLVVSLITSFLAMVTPAKADQALTVTTVSTFYGQEEQYGTFIDPYFFGWTYDGLVDGDTISIDPTNWVVEFSGDSSCGTGASESWTTTSPLNVGDYRVRVRPLAILNSDGQNVIDNYSIDYTVFNLEITPRVVILTASNGGVYQYQTSSSSANLAPAPYVGWNYWPEGASLTYKFSTDPATTWSSTAPTSIGNYFYRPILNLNSLAPCNFEITDGLSEDHPVVASWQVYANPVLPVLPVVGPTPVAPTPVAPPAPDIKPTLDLIGGTYTYDGNQHPATYVVTPSDAKVTVTYSSLGGVPVNAGYYRATAVATFGKYSVTQYAVISITKAAPVLTWDKPAAITNTTALTTSNALFPKANVPGFFVYTPSIGTQLPAGNNRPLTALFTPTDKNNYAQASISTTIDVTAAPVNVAVSFKLSSFALSDSAIAQIEKAAQQEGVTTITVYGYVQPSNNLTADNKLSLQRANSVANQIKSLIPGVKVVIKAMGRTASAEPTCVAANNKCAVVRVS